MSEWPKVPDSKSGVPARVPGVRIPFSPPQKRNTEPPPEVSRGGSVCTSVCTPPLDEATIEAAIARLTSALGTVPDDVIADLVTERAALRAELRGLQEASDGVIDLDSRRRR
jgi:hypothetical protein